MKTRTHALLPFAAIAGLALAASSAQATSIAITNGDFETDVIATDSFLDGAGLTAPASWTASRTTLDLTFVVDGAALGPVGTTGVTGGHGPSDQFFLAHANNGKSTINQDTGLLWSALSAGDTLTITAWTAYRADLVPPAANTFFWLNDVDGSGLSSAAIDVTDGGATTAGEWIERTWEYTVTQTAIDASGSWGAVNVQLGVVDSGVHQTAFDDVSLEHIAIPEPSSVALLGLGGLALLRRRRKYIKTTSERLLLSGGGRFSIPV